METELGNPIEYSPELPRKEDPIHNEEMEAPYYLPHPSMMMQPPLMMHPQMEKNDFLYNLDKLFLHPKNLTYLSRDNSLVSRFNSFSNGPDPAIHR